MAILIAGGLPPPRTPPLLGLDAPCMGEEEGGVHVREGIIITISITITLLLIIIFIAGSLPPPRTLPPLGLGGRGEGIMLGMGGGGGKNLKP